MLISQLLRPFGYLTIHHPYKWVVDWFYPFVLSLVTVVSIGYGSEISGIVAAGGVVAMILSFVQSLPGFYIAALAAIATFGRADIDEVLPEPTPKVVVKYRGKANLINLTRRRFLAMLFAFLTAESLVLILLSIFLVAYGAPLYALSFDGVAVGGALFVVVVTGYFLMLYQLILSTFWGLYYLGYKLHE